MFTFKNNSSIGIRLPEQQLIAICCRLLFRQAPLTQNPLLGAVLSNRKMKKTKKNDKNYKNKMSKDEAIKHFSNTPIFTADLLVGQVRLYFPPTHLTFRQKGLE